MGALEKHWDEKAALHYVRQANAVGKGLFGPSLKRLGGSARDPVCDGLVKRGVLRIVMDGPTDECGYWLAESPH